MICGKCGKSIPDNAVFCGWCGVRCRGRVCAVCGTELRSDQLFCHECGTKCEWKDSENTQKPVSDAVSPVGMTASSAEVPASGSGSRAMQKLVIRRLRQNVGSDSWYCWVQITEIKDCLFGVVRSLKQKQPIKAEHKLLYDLSDISADDVKEVQIEIMYFKGDSPIAPGGVRMLVTVNQLHTPTILSFGLSDQKGFRDKASGNVYPQIEVTLSLT